MVEKRSCSLGAISPLFFFAIFCYLLLDFRVKTGTRFSLRDKQFSTRDKRSRHNEARLFDKRVLIAYVDSEGKYQLAHSHSLISAFVILSQKHLMLYIMKTCLYNFDLLKPHFYIVKLGFTGVYIIFLIFAQKHRLLVLVRTASFRRFQRVSTIYVLS